jgi:hypothetical protein
VRVSTLNGLSSELEDPILQAVHLHSNLPSMSCILRCWKPPKPPREAAKDEPRDEPEVQPLHSTLLPPLKPLDLPKILLEHQFALSDQGWTTITYDGPSDTLYQSSQKLHQTLIPTRRVSRPPRAVKRAGAALKEKRNLSLFGRLITRRMS